MSKAFTDPVPLTSPEQDESDIAECTQIFVCYVPEMLRGLAVLHNKYSDLRIAIIQQMKKVSDSSSDCAELMNALDCVELREEALRSLILSEIVLHEPSIAEHVSTCDLVSDWKVVRLIGPKHNKKSSKKFYHSTLQ
jgi:hypothetical protein